LGSRREAAEPLEAGREVTSMTGRPRRPGWTRDPLIVTASALLAAAVVFAAFSGWAWLSAPRASAAAPIRDEALRAGEQAVLNFNTLDYRHVDQGLSLWAQSSTGPLHRQVVAGRTVFEQQVRQARTVTTAKILDTALSSLNTDTGRARIIVALQITVVPATGMPVTKQSRLTGELNRTPTGWKLSTLGQVPVSAAAPGKTPGG
jgi:Mce-associated membrane protein